MGNGKAASEGSKAPSFCLPDQNGREICSKDLKGKWTVLYFYPKDDTSGCTMEAKDFTCSLEDFSKEGCRIVGISPDPMDSHLMFAGKHDLKLTLLSDVERKAIETYGVWKERSMYGKKFMGVERSTFLIDPELNIRKAWRNVKVEGHVQEVLSTLKALRR